MPSGELTALVVTSAHWPGDPRLNRHARYLSRSGVPTKLIAHRDAGRLGRIAASLLALRTIWLEKPSVVILVDPELFVLGSMVARARGSRAVIDVHEDYAKAAASREWIPTWLRPVIQLLAWVNDRLGRLLAHRTIVAAPELARPGDHVVPNVPDPAEFEVGSVSKSSPQVIYIGDVTEPRGALDLARLAAMAPEVRVLVIGKVSESLRRRMTSLAGPNAALEVIGRLPHEEAWARAAGSVAGLSWLHPVPAYREAVATKLWEYCAAGIPPLVSDLPGQRSFVSKLDPSLVCVDLEQAVVVIRKLIEDQAWRESLSNLARELAVSSWAEQRPDQRLYEAVIP
jgi:hypothetical protein